MEWTSLTQARVIGFPPGGISRRDSPFQPDWLDRYPTSNDRVWTGFLSLLLGSHCVPASRQ